jgi:hypothetical protein
MSLPTPAPNFALEPTASSFGSAALRLRFRRRHPDGRWKFEAKKEVFHKRLKISEVTIS